MSVIFVIVPVVTMSWPAVVTLAGAAAGALGFRLLESAAARSKREEGADRPGVDIEDENSKLLFEKMDEEQTLCFEKEGVKMEISRDHRGRIKIHVDGRNMSKEQLKAEGKKFMGRLRQQFAYQKVMEELRGKGFEVVNENSVEGRIKIHVRKYR